MSPKFFEDYELKIKVRAAMVKLGLDTSLINLSIHRGIVTLIGTVKEDVSNMQIKVIQRIKDDPFMATDDNDYDIHNINNLNLSDSASEKLLILETEVSKIPGIKTITFDFNNYKKSGGMWKKKS